MLRPRIIPCLLVRNKGLVKTVGFKEGKYVGDPINAVRIFNEKEADELMVLDIDATAKNAGPDLKMIQFWAAECRMPLCYGGGVTSVEHAKTIIGLGVEKVALSAAAVANPRLVSEIAEAVGNQSVVVVLDVKKGPSGRPELWTHNGTRHTGLCPIEFAQRMQQLGVGEIVVNSIDHDGQMKGYDLEIAARVRAAVTVPMTVLGGAGSLKDIGTLISRFGIIGASAGSLFVFKGVYKAVLINYPNPEAKDELIRIHCAPR
jgi:cyclase